MNLPELTVVVTTFQRPERLRKCLQSLVDAGVETVVVSGSLVSTEPEICDEFKGLSITESFRREDQGCNEAWIRGVAMARTKYVLILHDDDWLMPEFGRAYREEIYPQLKRGVGFATWRGKVVSDLNEIDEDVGCLRGQTRIASTAYVTNAVLDRDVTSPSPVISVFNRDLAFRTLREAEEAFTDSRHFTRPKMMVGNDILLYLRHAESYDSWFFLDRILTCYGGHDGSETARHRSPDKLAKLLGVYNCARDYFYKVRANVASIPPRFFHTWTDYVSTETEALRRRDFAHSTWDDFLYTYGEAYPMPVADGMFRTSQEVVGDVRPLPFLRDMLDYVAEQALENDYIMLTNDDIAVTPDCLHQLKSLFAGGGSAVFSWRHNFYHKLTYPMKDLRTGKKDGGVDLVAFRPATWRQYREQFPDFILGCEAWDYAYRTLIPELPGGRETEGTIYHEFHAPIWRRMDVRTSNPGQRYNRLLARNFFQRRSQSDEHIPKLDIL